MLLDRRTAFAKQCSPTSSKSNLLTIPRSTSSPFQFQKRPWGSSKIKGPPPYHRRQIKRHQPPTGRSNVPKARNRLHGGKHAVYCCQTFSRLNDNEARKQAVLWRDRVECIGIN
ncbi:hypothetical protein CDAR_238191 [Caerostris darwini]|uniref:Uncharacterized protein n=1 Tax=Caerostris darwini TaxID=1538125 RepID=A0AAV4TKS9_9ARAC|nr:hypothetical protein CDAR_238191 [Caerostris darwini]